MKSAWTYGLPLYPRTGNIVLEKPQYKVGDLVILSDFGLLISSVPNCEIGIVMAGPYDLYYPWSDQKKFLIDYVAYDVLVCDELIKRVPQEFLTRMIKEEGDE